ncbi:hypothetical protein [Hyphomonas sp.]|uniref:hypothetical protein n=1 Tax=Hyphomonas sp. TaxID=87 RepID=UPI0025B84413|nr:hypothetical protein [Hyphomonas sp.]
MSLIKALDFIEADIPFCVHTFGVSPCTATLVGENPTGTIKCFNSPRTCQDQANYEDQPVTWRFSKQGLQYVRAGIEAFALIEDISFTPQEISLGENLGRRASLEVVFRDQPWTDTGPGFDKYRLERGYDPVKQGSFWGKFRARQYSLRGRELRWYRGQEGQTLEEMEKRTFVVDEMDGPDFAGRFRIVAKDALKLADGDRAMAPMLSPGFLTSDLAVDDEEFTISPVGAGASYPISGEIAIGGKEICLYTRTGDVFDITRAQRNTPATALKAQDRVQLCLVYTAETAARILFDLFVNYASISATYIPLDSWDAEVAANLSTVYSRCIAEPTPVRELASQVVQAAGLKVWWDDLAPMIRLQVIKAIPTDAALLTPDNISVKDRPQVSEQHDTRVSDVWTYFAQNNPLKKVSDEDNYASVASVIDGQAQIDYWTPAIKKIYVPWIATGGRIPAQRVGNIILGRYRDPLRKMKCALPRGGLIVPVLGRGYQIMGEPFQDATGAPVAVPGELTRLLPRDADYALDLQEMLFREYGDFDPDERSIFIEADTYNLNFREAYQALYGDPDITKPATMIIEPNVIVGSTSTSIPALDIGLWPVDMDLTLIIRGRVQGLGGDGASHLGASAAPNQYQPPTAGGTSLYARFPVDVDMADGAIWAPGGGSGGVYAGGGKYHGGGGGQGSRGGRGGSGVNGGSDGHDGSRDAPGQSGHPSFFGGGTAQPGDTTRTDNDFYIGAAAGIAVDGWSYLTVIEAGDVVGTTFN